MSSPTLSRRPLQRLGLAGIGSAVLFVGIASPALAATGVVIPRAPTEVALLNYPAENYGGEPMGPMTGPTGAGLLVLAGVGAVVVRTRHGPGVDN